MPVINLDATPVSYMDSGGGVPVVFVPGLAGSKEWFCYQAYGLSDRYRVVSYDLRKSSGHIRYNLDLLVNDLTRLLDGLRIYAAVIVGHGLGGLIALKFAAMHPERCPALILCSTTPSFPDCTDDEFISYMLPGQPQFESTVVKWWKKWFVSRPNPAEAGPYGKLAECLAKIDHPTLIKRLEILRNTDLQPLLSDIEVPTLVVAAASDPRYVLSGSQELEEGIPGAALEIIEDADRFYFHTRHDLFNLLIADYIAEKIALF